MGQKHNSKKLCIYLAKLENSGGIESHIFEFLEAFKSTGVHIQVIVSNMLMENDNLNRIHQLCADISYPRSNNKFSRLGWFIKTCVTLILNRVDALYTNGQGGSFWVISKAAKYKEWVHHHHTSGDVADQKTWSSMYRKVLQEADVIIACSTKNAKDIHEVINRPVISIPCFSRKIIPTHKQTNTDCIKFGYYGRLIPEKGIDILMALSKDVEIENVEFHIWGTGWAYNASNFEGLNRFFYHGAFNSQEELNEIVNFIDAYLLISRHPEGLPISLLEVMSAGVPWLATSVGGIPDIACDPVSTRLISIDSDYQKIKEAVILFANDIRNNKIHADTQMQLYNSKFEAVTLTLRWRQILKV